MKENQMFLTIAIEGPDRVGKQTQTKLLTAYLRRGPKTLVLNVEVPVEGPFYDTIYWMLKNGLAKRFPNLFQTVHFFNKFCFQHFVLKFMVKRYSYVLTTHANFVVFDRWKLSSMVYGLATRVNKRLLDFFDKRLIEPDVTIILDGRAQVEEKRDVYERDLELQVRVRDLYASLADNKKKRFLVNANQTPIKVHSDIINVLESVGIFEDISHS